MKKYSILIMLCFCFSTVQAQQKIEKHIDFSGKESVVLNIQIADSISIHTWNKDEVFVTASVNINDNKDNDAYETAFDDKGNSVSVTAKFKDQYFKGKNNCCNETDIYWQVYIPEKTGLSIETVNANVTIDGQTEKMKVKSISGYIDLSSPANMKADIDFSTISGMIYTNHDFSLHKMHTGIPVKISEKLNSGGVPIKLETISGDIFFRKSN